MIRILLICFCCFTFFSCDRHVVFEENIKLPENKWFAENIITLQADIPDSLQPYNIYINVRNAGKYQYSNLFVFFTTTTPDKRSERDTVELMLADPSGKWLGEGLGDTWNSRLLFKSNFRFPLTGTYTFKMEQAMRTNPLPHIMDMGLRIEKVQ